MPDPGESIKVDSMGNMVIRGSSSNSSQDSSLSSPPSSDLRMPAGKSQSQLEQSHNSASAIVPSISTSLVSHTKNSAFGLVHHGKYGVVGGSRTAHEVLNPGGKEEARKQRATSESPQDDSAGSSESGQRPISSQKQEPLNMSDGSGNSRNVVTGTTGTTTTSSGDDPDYSSWGNGGMSAVSSLPRDESSNNIVRLHHHHHRSRRSRVLENDGSTLQVPGEDGFHRILGAGPAAVVASRLPPPNSDTTTNASSSGSGGEAEPSQETLLQPHREPGYHTIRKTFSRLPKRGAARLQRSSATDSSSTTLDETAVALKSLRSPSKSSSQQHHEPKTKKLKLASKKTSRRPRETTAAIRFRDPDPVDGRESDSVGSSNHGGEGSSSGSGTEGGYAGSASSNENSGQQESSSSSSPSESSSEEGSRSKSKRHHHHHHHRSHKENRISKRSESNENYSSSSSSEIADFSSGASILNEENAVGLSINTFDQAAPSASPSLSSANEESLDELDEAYLNSKESADAAAAMEEDQVQVLKSAPKKRKTPKTRTSWTRNNLDKWTSSRPYKSSRSGSKRTPILRLGSDVMAHVLTFLHPPDILDVLTMPLSKEWRTTFTLQPELWRVLCLVEPFKARMEDGNTDSDTSSEDSLVSNNAKLFDKGLLDRYRLLYTSFVRCMKYLSQIREDALNGREPTFIDYGGIAERGRSSKRGPPLLLGSNRNLQLFMARARGVVEEAKSHSENSENESTNNGVAKVSAGYTSPEKVSIGNAIVGRLLSLEILC